MKKTMLKKLSTIAIGLSAMLMLSIWSSAYAASWTDSTDVDLEIEAWLVTIFAPGAITFPAVTVLNTTWHTIIDTAELSTWQTVTWSQLTWSYFWLEDLKWHGSWYVLKIMNDDLRLDTNTWVVIPKSLIKITMSWSRWDWFSWTWQDWLFLLDWEAPNEIQTITWDELSFTTELWILSRTWATTPAIWRLWMYWVQPIFDIYIPKYQQLWTYTTTFTLTIQDPYSP